MMILDDFFVDGDVEKFGWHNEHDGILEYKTISRNSVNDNDKYLHVAMSSFRLRDNSVHLHECSPFLVGIYVIFKKKTTMITVYCRHAHSDWQALKQFYMLKESLISC